MISKYHYIACGPVLCPLKHGDGTTRKTKAVSSQKKRNALVWNWDGPQVAQLGKRQKIVYDDDMTPEEEDEHGIGTYNVTRGETPHEDQQKNIESVSKNTTDHSKQTCFIWYHCTCRRSGGKHCPMRYELSDPPKMAEPPPAYIHREACDIERCPGEAREEDNSCEKRCFERTFGAVDADAR